MLILFIGIILAAAVQAGTGFGFSLMAMPLLLLIFPASIAVQLNLILSLLLSLGMFRHVSSFIDWALLRRLLFAGIFALPLGVPLLFLKGPYYQILIGVTVLFLTVILIVAPKFNQSKGGDYLTGGLSTLMALGFGMPGPPLMLYLTATRAGKELVRSTALSFYLLVYLAALVAHGLHNGLDYNTLCLAVAFVPAILIGTWIGRWAYEKISPANFLTILYVLLTASGLIAVGSAWR